MVPNLYNKSLIVGALCASVKEAPGIDAGWL